MARIRRRRSKEGLPRKIKKTSEDLKRDQLFHKAFGGNLSDKRYGFVSRHLGKVYCCVFRHPFAAKHFLNLILADDEIIWDDDKTITTSTGVEVSGDQLRLIFDYRFKRSERELFALGENYVKSAMFIRNDTPYPEFNGSEPQTYRKRHSRRGMIKMEEVAEAVGLSPKACRAALRKANVKKPEHGWAWRTQAEADQIIALITGKKKPIRIDFTGVTNED